MGKHYTNKYKRDTKSKALVATDVRLLDKHKKQKVLIDTVNQQTEHINKLESDLKYMQQQIQELLERNK